EAEPAGGAARSHLRLEDLLDADQVDPLLGLHLHPHVAATAAATETARAVARELDDPEPRHRSGDVARRLQDAVVAAEIAGVVERERRGERLRRLDPTRASERVDRLRVGEGRGRPAARVAPG